MKLSEQWLRDWVNPAVDLAILGKQLTMAGLEIESIEPAAGDFTHVFVGQVKSVKKHPEADKLHLCEVDAGTGELLPIVCGAKNVFEGNKYPVAMVGANLPGGITIKRTNLRGEASHGMLCAAAELGLGTPDTQKGILQLPDDAPVGKDFREYLNLNDAVVDVAITPNRGDCLSIQGIAREVAAMNKMAIQPPFALDLVPAKIQAKLAIQVQSPNGCPRYLGRIIKGIDASAKTPLWMQERLRRSGNRGIHPVIDVTNYVMLELGQPMHAFDLKQLSGGIVVRQANKGEQLTLLGGQTIELHPEAQLVADSEKPLAIAGVMGGEQSSVTSETQDILLESAFFTPLSVIQGSRPYNLHSDSSYRFERGVDPKLQTIAMERATALLLEIVGGEPGPIAEVASAECLPQSKAITLREARIESILGIALSKETVEELLNALNMRLTQVEGGWQVIPPSYRSDIAIEADLIEEVARQYGYNNLPKRFSMGDYAKDPTPPLPMLTLREKINAAFTQQGYREALTYSFVDPAIQTQLFPEVSALKLENAISPELSVMRVSLWPGLIKTLQYNQNRQQSNMRFFEIGLCFYPGKEHIEQPPVLGAAIMGKHAAHWSGTEKSIDFFDIKGHLESLLVELRILRDCQFVPTKHHALHPGVSAEILYKKHCMGYMGMLHPSLQKSLNLETPVYLFELQLTPIMQAHLPVFATVPKFPSIGRDLAIVVNKNVSYQSINAAVREVGGPFLKTIEVFDVYAGEGIPEGKHSLAMSLTFQENSRTLHEEEVNAVMVNILDHLSENFEVRVRK